MQAHLKINKLKLINIMNMWELILILNTRFIKKKLF